MKISGKVTLTLTPEERVFLINSFKTIMPKTELEERIAKRFILRLLRKDVHNFPLYPDQECPYCERSFKYTVFKIHKVACRAKRKQKEASFKVDQEVLDRILHG